MSSSTWLWVTGLGLVRGRYSRAAQSVAFWLRPRPRRASHAPCDARLSVDRAAAGPHHDVTGQIRVKYWNLPGNYEVEFVDRDKLHTAFNRCAP